MRHFACDCLSMRVLKLIHANNNNWKNIDQQSNMRAVPNYHLYMWRHYDAS